MQEIVYLPNIILSIFQNVFIYPLCMCVQQLEDEIQISFHGVAYVDFAPLLYPGVRRIRGAYRIHPFSDTDLLMKVQVDEIT